DDVRLSPMFDDVDAVEVDSECPAAPQNHVAQIGRERERLPQFFFFGLAGKDLLDGEQSIADYVDLAIAAIRRMVALGEHRLAALVRYFFELRPASDDSHMVTARSLIRLDDERRFVQKRSQSSRFRGDESGRRGHSGRLQDSDRDDLVM